MALSCACLLLIGPAASACLAADPAPRFPADPRSVPGLVLWLDAADADSIIVDAAGVSQWRDRSGHANHVSQPDPTARPQVSAVPQGGFRPLAFDGSTQYLRGPAVLQAGAPAYTIFALWKPRSRGVVQSVFEQAATPLRPNTRAALLAVGNAYGFNGESNDCHQLGPVEPDRWRLTCMAVDNSRARNVSLCDNGATYTGATANPSALRLGASGITIGRKLAADAEYLCGELAEVLVYEGVPNSDARREILWYLDHKWGVDCLGWFRSPEGRLVAFDFDGETYEGWTAEGSAFGPEPVRGTLPGQMPVSGFRGDGLVNTFLGGDGSTGTLTSPPVVIERRYIQFLIGGGMYPGEACVNLLVDGQVVRTATGPNDRPGGTETLEAAQWDVSDLTGRTATLQIVDRVTGGWGHINVDHIIQTDRPLPAVLDRSRRLVAHRPYLNLPVRDGAPPRRMMIAVDGRVERDFIIPLAEGQPDYWVFMDLLPFQGMELTLQVQRLPEDCLGLEAIEQSASLRDAADLYREALRPQVHFTTRRGWLNDPNGLVYYAGEWHLFYQHNPYSTRWENMHWGHAVSPDLVHWTELPVALYPDALGSCFSGSAVVDEGNTAGFQTGAEKPLVCIYTAAGSPFTQCIAYSLDRGRTWSKYSHNPVLGHIIGANRDPRVIWYAPERKWIMVLYLDGNDYGLFSSVDLKQWEQLSTVTVPGVAECPEFFEIPVKGTQGETRWILYGGNGNYLVGNFDGCTFTPESGPHVLNHGNCFYASQTFNNAPDGRRVQIAWGTVSMPAMPFNQMMNFPVELTLNRTDQGLRLFANPVAELALLHDEGRRWEDLTLRPEDGPLVVASGELLHMRGEFEVSSGTAFALTLPGIPVSYEARSGQFTCLGHTVPLAPQEGRVCLEMIMDRTSLEVFGNDGALYMPMGLIPSTSNRAVELSAVKGPLQVRRLQVWTLKSIWP